MIENSFDPISEKTGFQSTLFTRVFGWMFAGLLITAITAWSIFYVPAIARVVLPIVFGNTFNFFILIILEFALVFFLTRNVVKMNYGLAIGAFMAYAIVNGLTLSVIFFAYEIGLIFTAFLATAGMFGVMALYGYFTKNDLSTVGRIAMMGLFGLIIATLVNLFFASSGLDYIITYIGIIVFIGLTAYDVQKIKNLSENYSNDDSKSLSILCALTLYLDFINLFLYILRLLGRRRN